MIKSYLCKGKNLRLEKWKCSLIPISIHKYIIIVTQMLVKAFNRLPMTEGFGGKNESDKKKKNKY